MLERMIIWGRFLSLFCPIRGILIKFRPVGEVEVLSTKLIANIVLSPIIHIALSPIILLIALSSIALQQIITLLLRQIINFLMVQQIIMLRIVQEITIVPKIIILSWKTIVQGTVTVQSIIIDRIVLLIRNHVEISLINRRILVRYQLAKVESILVG
jgi:hypothetical protein